MTVFTVGFSGPYPVLIKKRPLGTLAGLNVLLSLIVHLVLVTATQLALWYYIKTRQWLVTLDVIQVLISCDTEIMCIIYCMAKQEFS